MNLVELYLNFYLFVQIFDVCYYVINGYENCVFVANIGTIRAASV